MRQFQKGAALLLAVVMLLSALPTLAEEVKTGTVQGADGSAPYYYHYSFSDANGTLQNGTTVTIEQTEGDWYLISVVDGGTALRVYMRKTDIREAAAAPAAGGPAAGGPAAGGPAAGGPAAGGPAAGGPAQPKLTPVNKAGWIFNLSDLTLYKEATAGSDSLGSYPAGTEVFVEGIENNVWYKVRIGDKKGYMPMDFITLTAPTAPPTAAPTATPTPAPTTAPSQGTTTTTTVTNNGDGTTSSSTSTVTYLNKTGRVNAAMVPLYKEKSWSSAILGNYSQHAPVTVLAEYDHYWYEVRTSSQQGFMLKAFVTLDPTTPTPSPAPTATPAVTPPAGSAVYMYVNMPANTGKMNVYLMADVNSMVLGSFATGTMIKVLNWGSTWSYVEVGLVKGYASTRYLSYTQPSAGNYLYATVNNPNPADRLNLRAQASSGSTSLGKYYNGTSVRVLEYGNTWCYVQVEGKTGYMMTRYLYFGSAQPTATPAPTYPPYTPPSGDYITAIVANDNPKHRLNLRQWASTEAPSLGRYFNGTIVRVYEYGREWCRVQVAGISGYMATAYLSFGGGGYTPTPTAPPVSTGTAYVNNPKANQRLNLRASASTGSRSLGQFYNGTEVQVINYGSQWCYVRVGSMYGYMSTQYLTYNKSAVVNTAYVNNPKSNQVLNLRALASVDSRSLGQYYNGTVVTILQYEKTWCYVSVDGKVGSMMTEYLRF
ncbi:MAG: SH3 domain-containing protein [Oscillospiraceae bacterium]|jgi:uncharacterized protein YgiM (DUF1202 family)|nr:SH3 domain-containing protein [Oscillospiraceae bacterium]